MSDHAAAIARHDHYSHSTHHKYSFLRDAAQSRNETLTLIGKFTLVSRNQAGTSRFQVKWSIIPFFTPIWVPQILLASSK